MRYFRRPGAQVTYSPAATRQYVSRAARLSRGFYINPSRRDRRPDGWRFWFPSSRGPRSQDGHHIVDAVRRDDSGGGGGGTGWPTEFPVGSGCSLSTSTPYGAYPITATVTRTTFSQTSSTLQPGIGDYFLDRPPGHVYARAKFGRTERRVWSATSAPFPTNFVQAWQTNQFPFFDQPWENQDSPPPFPRRSTMAFSAPGATYLGNGSFSIDPPIPGDSLFVFDRTHYSEAWIGISVFSGECLTWSFGGTTLSAALGFSVYSSGGSPVRFSNYDLFISPNIHPTFPSSPGFMEGVATLELLELFYTEGGPDGPLIPFYPALPPPSGPGTPPGYVDGGGRWAYRCSCPDYTAEEPVYKFPTAPTHRRDRSWDLPRPLSPCKHIASSARALADQRSLVTWTRAARGDSPAEFVAGPRVVLAADPVAAAQQRMDQELRQANRQSRIDLAIARALERANRAEEFARQRLLDNLGRINRMNMTTGKMLHSERYGNYGEPLTLDDALVKAQQYQRDYLERLQRYDSRIDRRLLRSIHPRLAPAAATVTIQNAAGGDYAPYVSDPWEM